MAQKGRKEERGKTGVGMHATRWAVTVAEGAVASIVIMILIRRDGIQGPLLLLLIIIIKVTITGIRYM